MIQRLGWTLIHFLWQGTAIVAVYAILRSLAGRSISAQARYSMACAALLAMAVTPLVTFLLIPREGGPWAPSASVWTGFRTLSTSAGQRLLPGAVALWLVGVLVFSVRLFGGWRFAARLRSTSHPAPPEWQLRLGQIAARLGASHSVRLLVSPLVNVPTVIGWLRPVILLPVVSLTGMPVEHITALLGHELAHIRRNDYLASILQSVVEVILFYHPAVWWISEQIRAERELCCDDLAVAACGDALIYSRALAELELRQTSGRPPVLAANGGSLVNRIRRLLEPVNSTSNNFPAPGAAWAMALLWFAGVGVASIPAAQTSLPLPHVTNRNPSPFSAPLKEAPEPASPVIALATHARRTLLFDPFLPAQLPQTQAASDNDKLLSPLREWLREDVAFIITNEERNAFMHLTTDEERAQFVEQFWSRRDPTLRDEHYRRIAYANQHFSWRIPGWKTDRGRIYITYGPPDEIDAHPSGAPPFEHWRYRLIEGVGNNVVIEFTDPTNTGEYRMTPNALPENFATVAPSEVAAQTGKDPDLLIGKIDPYTILPMLVQIDYVRATGTSTTTNITFEFDNRDLQFQQNEGVERSLVNLFGRITTMTRRPLITFEKPLETMGPVGTLQRGQRSVYRESVQLAPGRYRLNLVAKDTVSGNLDRYEAALDVPEFAEGKLASSSLILADTIQKMPAKAMGSIFGMGDMRVRPRLNKRFTTEEKLGIYLEVYNFTPDQNTQKPSGSIEYEIEKATSSERVLDFSEEVAQIPNSSASQVTVEKMLPLRTFVPGTYTLKVTMTDRNGNQTLQRQGSFSVVAQ